MKSKLGAHIALFSLNLLYALSYFVIKSVAPDYLSANGFVLVRVVGALLLFWTVDLFLAKEKIHRSDWWKFAVAACFGVVFNQLSFFNGMTLTSPNYSAIIMTTTPLIVMVISAFYLREKITRNKLLGVGIGLFGAITIIVQNKITVEAPNPILGNLLIFSNAANFGFFIVFSKQLMMKYKPITVLKWVFLIGAIILIPIGGPSLLATSWNFPTEIWGSIIYVVVGITFLTFLLNMYAITKVSPNVSTSYIFFQPLMAATLSYIIEGTIMDFKGATASLLIFIGVYFISFRKDSISEKKQEIIE